MKQSTKKPASKNKPVGKKAVPASPVNGITKIDVEEKDEDMNNSFNPLNSVRFNDKLLMEKASTLKTLTELRDRVHYVFPDEGMDLLFVPVSRVINSKEYSFGLSPSDWHEAQQIAGFAIEIERDLLLDRKKRMFNTKLKSFDAEHATLEQRLYQAYREDMIKCELDSIDWYLEQNQAEDQRNDFFRKIAYGYNQVKGFYNRWRLEDMPGNVSEIPEQLIKITMDIEHIAEGAANYLYRLYLVAKIPESPKRTEAKEEPGSYHLEDLFKSEDDYNAILDKLDSEGYIKKISMTWSCKKNGYQRIVSTLIRVLIDNGYLQNKEYTHADVVKIAKATFNVSFSTRTSQRESYLTEKEAFDTIAPPKQQR